MSIINIRPVSFIFLILILSTISMSQRNESDPSAIIAKVDRRIELASIVVRLAGYDEYQQNVQKKYASDVDVYFQKFRDHPVVALARRLREENGIGFDAVPSLAVHLGHDLDPKFPFTDSAPDKRWGGKNAAEFAALLKKFAADTHSDAFFDAHTEFYKTVESRMQEVVDKIDLKWYRTFYGEMPNGTFNLYIGLLNGGMNFGPKVIFPDKHEELYAVIGAWQADESGLPVFTDNFLPIIIHEFNHSFVNHVFDENIALFRSYGPDIYTPVADKMRSQAYADWQTTLAESLVRAAVCRYLYDHQKVEQLKNEFAEQESRGFLWIDDLFILMGAFESDRARYPTFRSYMPHIAGYLKEVSAQMPDRLDQYDSHSPKIAAVETFKNGDQDVDPNIKEITFVFDRPLSGQGRSINESDHSGDSFPVKEGFRYSPDKMKVAIEVDLKPDTEYGFTLTGLAFKTRDGFSLKNYTIRFRTRK